MPAPKENRPKASRPNEYTDDRDTRPAGLSFALLLLSASLFRFLFLGAKPPHFDEGINGHFVLTMWRDGFYTYDPTNFHGPLYFYLCHLAEVLFGRGVESFRIMNAFISVGLVAAVFQFRRFFGRTAVIAAWVIAVSPAFVFYGRYAIHESLFILGQIVFVYGRFVWMAQPRRDAIFAMAAGTVIMITTKETFFIFFGTWLIAEAMIWFLERLERSHEPSHAPMVFDQKRFVFDTAVAVVLTSFVIVSLFTGFFERSQGWVDFFRAFKFWSSTGANGHGHDKSFFYWVSLLARYEWPLLFGLVASVALTIVLRVEERKLRILMLFGFGHWLAYSLIPYKTPWLILNFWPLAFFALRPSKLVNGVVALAIMVSGFQAWRLCFKSATDPLEPYVYVQTTTDYSNVLGVLTRQLKFNPEIRNVPIVVMIKDPWPLPYDLSVYPFMSYGTLASIDADPSILKRAGLVLVDGSSLAGLRNIFPKRFARLSFKVRDAYEPGWALFDPEFFREALPLNADIELPASEKETP